MLTISDEEKPGILAKEMEYGKLYHTCDSRVYQRIDDLHFIIVGNHYTLNVSCSQQNFYLIEEGTKLTVTDN